MQQYQIETELLVLAAQQGNSDAFTLLFRRHHRSLLQYACQYSGSEDMAKEAVQEAWIETARNIKKLSDPRAFRSWLYKKVRWRILDEVRKSVSSATVSPEELASTESSVGEMQHNELLILGLRRLPTLEREMIQLFYLDDMSISEIAAVLEIPSGTVKSRLNRARNLLKQKLSEEELS